MKTLMRSLLLLPLLLLGSVPARAQVARLNFASQTTNGQCVPGALCPILAIPGSVVQVCTYSVSGCGSVANTYSDATGTTQCPTYAQVTPGCTSTTDANGNGGIWVTSGNYNVFWTPPGGQQQGPYPFTSGGGGGGGGTCPQGPAASIQINNGANCTGSTNLTFSGQVLNVTGPSGGVPSIISQVGQIQSNNGFISASGQYNGYSTNGTDGIAVPGYQVLQNSAGNIGGYMVFKVVTYNPYNQSGMCLDQWGNPVQQPLPLPGTNFGMYDSVLWVGSSPSLPAAPTAGCPTPGGPPLPVNPNNALNGLNTNSYFFARGGLATDDAAYNSIQSLLGGASVYSYFTGGQGFNPGPHASSSTLDAPGVCIIDLNCDQGAGFGGIAYTGIGEVYWIWNATSHTWIQFNFASGGGTGCTVTAPSLAILTSNGSSGCTGSSNAEVDANGNLSLSGSGSVLDINGATGGLNVTTDGAYNSIQTVGGYLANLSIAGNAGLTIVGASAQTKNLAEFYTHTPTLVASVSAAGAGLFSGLTLSNIASGTQCLHASSSGVVSGTGSDCGAGGGGGTPVYLTFAAATTGTFGALSAAGASINCYTTGGAWTIPSSITGLATTTPTVNFSSAFTGTCAAVVGGGGGGGGSPGVPVTSVQTNQGGVFTGNTAFEYDNTALTVKLTGQNTAFPPSVLSLYANTAGQDIHQSFYDGATLKWTMGKSSANDFYIFDSVSATSIFDSTSGGAGIITMNPPSGKVIVNGKAGVAGVVVNLGYLQSDGGYLCTPTTCNAFNAVNLPTAGFLGQNLNIAGTGGVGGYIAMASGSPTPSTGDNWSAGPGILSYNVATRPTWYFQSGSGTATATPASISALIVTATGTTNSFTGAGTFSSSAAGTQATFSNANGNFFVNGNGLIQVNNTLAGVSVLGDTAFNSIQTVGGMSAVGMTVTQAFYATPHTGCAGLASISPATNSGGISYSGGTTYCYWNSAGSGAWQTVDFSLSGGGPWSISGANIFYNTGNVGIGNSSPTFPLEVNGSIAVANNAGLVWADGSGAPLGNKITRNTVDGSMQIITGQADIELLPLFDVLIGSTTDAATGKLQVTGAVSATGGYYSGGTSFNQLNIPGGGALTNQLTMAERAAPTSCSSGFDGFYADSTTHLIMACQNSGGWVAIGTGGSGVPSIQGTANQIFVNGGTSVVTGAATLTLPSSILITNAYSSGATGGSIAFQTSNFDFQVDGQGDVSALTQFNVTGGSGSYKMGGTIFLNASLNLSVANATISGSETIGSTLLISGISTFNSAATFNGGITTNGNSAITIGTGGNFYTHATGGSSTGVSCASVPDGWQGLTTDDYLVQCIGGARFRAALSSY